MQSKTTTITNDKRTGHTVESSWAQLAKKAMTPQDKSVSDALEAKIKSDAVEKKRKEHEAYLDRKRKEHEAYLERKERRERIAKEKKAQEDADYKLYVQHMWFLHGNNWYMNFEEGSSRENEIPEPFYDRVQQEIQEDYSVHYEMEAESEKNWKEKEAAKAIEKEKMKAILSREKYQKWKRQQDLEFYEEVDDYLDRGFCEMSEASWIMKQRESNGKIWLEEKMKNGEIVLGADGKYKYFGKV